MESAPTTTESNPDDKEKKDKQASGKSSEYSPVAVGIAREKSKDDAPDDGQERDSLWRRLIGPDRDPKPAEEREEGAAPAEAGEAAGEPPLEALSPDEEQYVIREVTQARQALAAEQAAAEPEASETAEAVNRYHARILEAGESPADAAAETLRELGVEDVDGVLEAAADPRLASPAEAVEWPLEFGDEGVIPLAPPAETAGSETPADDVPESVPPEAADRFAGPPFGPRAYDLLPGGTGDYVPLAAAEAAAAVPVRHEGGGYDKADVVGAAVVSGVIGYLIGRRRGRIKTEKRLLPVQKKLEKRVQSLQRDITNQEFAIRQIAEDHTRELRRTARSSGRKETGTAGKRAEEASTESGGKGNRRYPEAAASGGAIPRSEAAARSAAGPFGETASTGPLDREHLGSGGWQSLEQQQIGHVLMSAGEAMPLGIAEAAAAATLAARHNSRASRAGEALTTARPVPEIESAPPVELDKHVETLSQKDLLELSDKIVVEGTSLRQAYESHQIGERALRRIISEHLRGGDVRRALRRESVQHQIDFERDPQLRDRARARGGAGSSGGGKALSTLMQRADVAIGGQAEGEELAVLEAREAYQLKEQTQVQRQQRLINLSLISIIAVLLALVVLLIVSRG